jgi:hypothetical protein
MENNDRYEIGPLKGRRANAFVEANFARIAIEYRYRLKRLNWGGIFDETCERKALLAGWGGGCSAGNERRGLGGAASADALAEPD